MKCFYTMLPSIKYLGGGEGYWVQTDIQYYYLKDYLGTIKMTVHANGNVTSYNDYYPFGIQMAGRSMASSGDKRYRFISKERNVETGYDQLGTMHTSDATAYHK